MERERRLKSEHVRVVNTTMAAETHDYLKAQAARLRVSMGVVMDQWARREMERGNAEKKA